MSCESGKWKWTLANCRPNKSPSLLYKTQKQNPRRDGNAKSYHQANKTYLMPPKKKTKVAGADDDETTVAVHQLEDIMANILGWLCVEEIMGKRRVCKKWTEAVKKTIVPLSRLGLNLNNVENYNAMEVMTRAMPNLQQITICGLGNYHKWSDGEDPDEEVAARTADRTTHDIEIITNFSKLRILNINAVYLNGRYPNFFNFPLLQKLSIKHCGLLKWDLEMLAALPLLRELDCEYNNCLTGNIGSLRVIKDTLEKVKMDRCYRVEGNFMDLADFPHLKELNLFGSDVTGDIRDIGQNDFSSLEELILPHGVYGGHGYELQRISDAPDVTRIVYLFHKQRPGLIDIASWYVQLSEDSPDWYESEDLFLTPFYIRLVQAGSRIGYRWQSCYHEGSPCEVNWLDPEPNRESSDYGQYIEELQKIENEMGSFRRFHQPPTEEEYERLWEEFSTVLP